MGYVHGHAACLDGRCPMFGLNQAEFYGFDLDELQVVADRVGPTPEDLGQTDEAVLAKWDRYKKAGRPWLTEIEVPG